MRSSFVSSCNLVTKDHCINRTIASYGIACYHLASFMHYPLPNDDVGRPNQHFRIVSTGLVFWDAMIFCNNFARWLQKIVATCCVGFSGMLRSFVTTLCSPNEDFGRPNQHFRMRFRSTFQRFVAQILYSRPLKKLRKCSLTCLFNFARWWKPARAQRAIDISC